MNYDMVKYERGQVWMIRHKNNPDSVGREQAKDRPWLILSVGKFNKSSGMVTAVPITTRDNVRTISQVLYANDRGYNNVIMCEQIKTFDYTSGAYIFDFMGQLSNEILEKVDVALSIHLGLHYSPLTLNKLYDSMEAIIKSVGYLQEKDNSPKFSDDDVLQFAEKLQEIAGYPAFNEVSATHEEEIQEGVPIKVANANPYIHKELERARGTYFDEDEENSGMEPISVDSAKDSKKEDKSISSSKEKSPRIKWTPELCKEFIQDASTLPMKKVMEKWNISKKTRFYSMKNYAESLLTKKTES